MIEKTLKRYRCVLGVVGRIEIALTVLLLFGIVASMGAQVVSRYFFNNPIIWVEESVVYAFIWSVFLGASVALKAQRHIRIEWLSHLAGPRAGAALFVMRQLVVLSIVITVFPYALAVMDTESRSSTVTLPWELPRFMFFSLPLTVSFALIAATALYFLAAGLRALPAGAAVAPVITLGDDDYDEVERIMVKK